MSCELIITNISITGDCSNTNSGAFSFDLVGTSPPFTLTWLSPSLPPEIILTSPYYYELTGLSADTYSFQIQDSCISPGNLTVSQNIYVSSGTCVNIDMVGHTTCGLDNGTLTASTQNYYANTEFYLYELTDGYIKSGTSFTNEIVFDSLSAGTYYVVGDDGGGCTGTSQSCIVKTSTTFTYDLYIVDNAGCAGTNSGAIYVNNLNGVPPYTYLWSNSETTSYITGLTAGSYFVTVTDSTGCVVTESAVVQVVPPVGLGTFISTPPTCFNSDGQLTITITGGTPPYYYSGSNGSSIITFSQTHTFTGLPAGAFFVKVTDAGLCSFVASDTLLSPGGFSIGSITVNNSNCSFNDGEIIINLLYSVAPFVYTITGDGGSVITSYVTSSPTWNFTGLESGTYQLSISGGSCVYNTTVVVNNTPLLFSDYEVTGTTCGGSNGAVKLSVTGGSGNYTYGLTGQLNVSGGFSSYTFTNLSAGNYVGTITDTLNSCTVTENIVVPSSPSVNVTLFGTNPTPYSNNGTITAFITSGTPPFTWTWSPNANGQTTLTITNLSAGTYDINVIDSEGCIRNKKITLVGSVPLTDYQLYNICDSNFANTGTLLTKGIKQMLNEGFYDLTSGDTNCILNQSIFTIFLTVGDLVSQSSFFTGTTLNEYPSNEQFSNVLENLLDEYAEITGVTINMTENTIKLTTPCNTLSGTNIEVDLLINYDISCEALATVSFDSST